MGDVSDTEVAKTIINGAPTNSITNITKI